MMSQSPQSTTPSKTITTNKSNRLVLIDRKKMRQAQRILKQFPGSWSWKICMHMAKQAYGVSCKAPLPEIGDLSGNFTCAYINKEKGEYSFSLVSPEIKHTEARHD